MHKRLRILPALALLLAIVAVGRAPDAGAQTPGGPSPSATPASTAAAPESVTIGLYIRDIYDLDLKNGTYEVDFDLWVEWKGAVDPTGFAIMNGKKDDQEKMEDTTLPNGVRSVMYRCQYRFHQALDRHAYPLDAHRLSIRVEDSQHTVRQMVYVLDRRWRPMGPGVKIPGWAVGRPELAVRVHDYPAEPGAALAPGEEETYSMFEAQVPLRRPDAGIFLKTFLVLFISVAVGLLSPLLTVRQVEARLGLGLASVFGVVSSYVVASANLPETGEMTLTDKLHAASMAIVFLSILASVALFRNADRLGDDRAERIDARQGIIITTGALIVIVVLCIIK